MAKSVLDVGQMLTGRYGRRFMVKEQICDKESFQLYEVSESGKAFWAVAVVNGSDRIKNEFLEKDVAQGKKTAEFVWPCDTFNFAFGSLSGYGYIVEKPVGDYTLHKRDDKISLKDRYTIGINIARAFMKLHEAGYTYMEKPAVFINSEKEVCLVALPVKKDSKLTHDDILGEVGFNAPELFERGKDKIVTVYSDRFLLASMEFVLFIGVNPFDVPTVEEKRSVSAGPYTFFTFGRSQAEWVVKHSYERVEAWMALDDVLKNFFKSTFTNGVGDLKARASEEQWVYMLTKYSKSIS